MKQIHTLALALFSLMIAGSAFGQISFSDETARLNNPDAFTSGNAMAVADMNADGYDDIIRMNNNNMLNIEYQMTDTAAFTNYTFGFVPNEAWAIVVGDVNNDGYCDIMTGGFYDGVKVLTAMDNGSFYLSSTLPGQTIFVQGSNMADINNDGHLDVFACHDDGESRMWSNNGSGIFESADHWIDMRTSPPSDNSGNYGSVWTDFDNDGDIDLYIAKCRIGVNDPDDPRRINALFVNDGNNNYREAAEEHGLKIKHQSWTADFQDIDNDGDLDCFVTNHYFDLQLLENDGSGHFTDISQEAGILTGENFNFVQGIMKDFDNDGFVDIITAQPTLFFRNNGDKTFTELDPFGEDFGSLAAGDLNHDGFLDLYTSYQCGFNNPCGEPDKLWMNDGNDNHFLAVNLAGVQSNKMGVGARVEIHGSWGIQVREVRAGESYGISNSLTQTFGLADKTDVDHVVVKWPSGVVDVLSDVAADQFLTIEEGSTCDVPDFQLGDNETILCAGESITLTAPAGFTYLWSNGTNGQSITTNLPGHFSVVIVDDMGCAATSNVVKVTLEPDQTPAVDVDGETTFCEGGNVELTSSEASSYLWSNGESTQSITVTESGIYDVTITGVCNDFISETIEVEVLESADAPMADDASIIAPSTATLEATGENVYWYESLNAVDPIGVGNQFETPILTETTTYYVAAAQEHGGGSVSGGMPELTHDGDPLNGATINGQLLFEVYESVILREVTVHTDFPAIRVIELLDENDQVVESVAIDIPVGESVQALNFNIEPGFYRLTTNRDSNQVHSGTNSPKLFRSNEAVEYPYEEPGIFSILSSNYGNGFYYYFFDWKVDLQPTSCFSERIPVTVDVQPNAVKEMNPFGQLSIMPNPSNGQFTLEVTPIATGPAHLSITDLAGKQIFTDKFPVSQHVTEVRRLDLTEVAAGMYFLKITDGDRASWLKLVIE
ncbi:MAG: FG-GAP-like repeat-containing protein [Bacteroidota bacterium]